MIIELNTPKGRFKIESDTVTDKELSKLKITRGQLGELIPLDIEAEFSNVKARLDSLESK